MDAGNLPQQLIVSPLFSARQNERHVTKSGIPLPLFTGRVPVVMTTLLQVPGCQLKNFIGHVKAFQRKSGQIGTFAERVSLH